MTQTNDYNGRPAGPAEELIGGVFAGRVADADPQMARLRLERKLANLSPGLAPAQHGRPAVRFTLQAALVVCALVVLGGWASNITLKPWDDAQQVTMRLPDGWTPASYPRLIGEIRLYTDELYAKGGTSLIVDYKRDNAGGYDLQLGVLGVDYQTANDWTRRLLDGLPELGGQGYSITQPMVPYAVTVGDMLAYRLTGRSAAVERNVVAAWQQRSGASLGEPGSLSTCDPRLTSPHAMLYLITRDKDYARRVPMVEY